MIGRSCDINEFCHRRLCREVVDAAITLLLRSTCQQTMMQCFTDSIEWTRDSTNHPLALPLACSSLKSFNNSFLRSASSSRSSVGPLPHRCKYLVGPGDTVNLDTNDGC